MMRKTILRSVLILILLAALAPQTAAAVWHEAYICGFSDGTLRPEEKLTRAQLAQVLYRMMEEDTRRELDERCACFTDVAPNAWYYRAVTAVSELELLYGGEDGSFRPNEGVSREELALVLMRIGNSEAASAALPQLAESQSNREISFSAGDGWIMGFDGAVFRPDEPLTRAEFVQIMNCVLSRTPQSLDDLAIGMPVWRDNADSTAWYFLDMQEAAVGHTAEPNDAGEKWSALG